MNGAQRWSPRRHGPREPPHGHQSVGGGQNNSSYNRQYTRPRVLFSTGTNSSSIAFHHKIFRLGSAHRNPSLALHARPRGTENSLCNLPGLHIPTCVMYRVNLGQPGGLRTVPNKPTRLGVSVRGGIQYSTTAPNLMWLI